jgi:hypothetical protein
MEDNVMALILILELPTMKEARYLIEPEAPIAALQMERSIRVIPLDGPIAPPAAVDAEPTWEDAAWQ